MADNLTLYAEDEWVSPWVFHAMVALEEKELPYKLEVLTLPMPAAIKATLQDKAIIPKVPVLAHGDTWISESLAISEYLAETFPTPGHPRIFPADLGERARARQLMSMMRTSLFAMREDRPTSSVFGKPTDKPLSEKGKAEAAELVRIASRFVTAGKPHLFGNWCIADADLALMLMRLVANGDPVPQAIADYARAQWERKGVQAFLAHVG